MDEKKGERGERRGREGRDREEEEGRRQGERTTGGEEEMMNEKRRRGVDRNRKRERKRNRVSINCVHYSIFSFDLLREGERGVVIGGVRWSSEGKRLEEKMK